MRLVPAHAFPKETLRSYTLEGRRSRPSIGGTSPVEVSTHHSKQSACFAPHRSVWQGIQTTWCAVYLSQAVIEVKGTPAARENGDQSATRNNDTSIANFGKWKQSPDRNSSNVYVRRILPGLDCDSFFGLFMQKGRYAFFFHISPVCLAFYLIFLRIAVPGANVRVKNRSMYV